MPPIPPQLPPAHAGIGALPDARKILEGTHRSLGIVACGGRFIVVVFLVALTAAGALQLSRVRTTYRASRLRVIPPRSTDLLRTLGVPVLGMVVNGGNRRRMGYGYGYGYGGYGQTNGVAHGNGVNGSVSKDVTPPAVPKGRLGHDGDPSTA